MNGIVETSVREARTGATVLSEHAQIARNVESAAFPRASVSVVRYESGALRQASRNVICERALTLVVNGHRLVELLCSSAALRELALGFLYTEGMVGTLADVRTCLIDEDSLTASLELAVPVRKPGCPTISSGFGGKVLCSLSEGIRGRFDHPAWPQSTQLTEGRPFSMEDVMKAVGSMRSFAREYTVTRGIHCSALFLRGVPLASFEDIGRHNTFDKLAGHCLIEGKSAQGALLTTTGRVSSEMVSKAVRLGVSGIASLSGPTDRAIEMAQDAGVLLAGYVSENSAYVYAGV